MRVNQRGRIVEGFVAAKEIPEGVSHEHLLDTLGAGKPLHHFERVFHGTVQRGIPDPDFSRGHHGFSFFFLPPAPEIVKLF